jgi:pimeloyl-ACP methyl ester carboxylesterase
MPPRFMLLKTAGWCLLVLGTLAASASAVRAIAQHRNGRALALRAPGAVEYGQFVKLGGVEQWVQARGEDAGNPVVLVVHGGPGMSYVPLTPYFQRWERDFTVVQWDRRGVGRTFGRHGAGDSAAITFDRLADDGVELAQWLRATHHVDKIVLVGHSMGSVVATLMAKRRPDLFQAYVGTDQVVDMARNEAESYAMLVARAESSGDEKLVGAVRRVGPPPYRTADAWFEKQRLISATDPTGRSFENMLFKTVMTAPGYSMRDMQAFGQGLKFSAATLLAEMMTLDLRARGLDFALPVLLIEGENDVIDPTALATAWFQTIRAPRKQLVVLSGAGHNAVMTRSEDFLAAMREFTRPLLAR